jgi:hypothetical protein
MSSKTLIKSIVAFGVLAIVLIFLGVNFVPRISAFSPARGNTVDAGLIRDIEAARWQALGEAYLPVNSSARQADAARWQALGESYFAVNLSARQADAARWQALGEYYSMLSTPVSSINTNLIRDAGAARWQALGEAYFAVNLRARQADVARWQALGESYSTVKP